MSLGAVDRQNESIERAINYAKTQGTDKNGEPYYFIDLILRNAGVLSGSPEHFAISGIKELSPLPPSVDRNGKVIYSFDEQKGGYTRFREDRYGQFRYSLWDDPDNFNRRFLASHWDKGYWDIEDPVVEDQILQLYEELQKEALKESPVQRKLAVLQQRYKGAEEKEKKNILEQMQGLVSEHAEEVLPPEPKGHENNKKRHKYRIPPTEEQLAKLKERPRSERPVVQKSKAVVRVDEPVGIDE